MKNNEIIAIRIYSETKMRNPSYIISSFFEFVGTYVYTGLISEEITINDGIPTLHLATKLPDIRSKNICYINTSIAPWKDVNLGNCSLEVLGGLNENGQSNAFLPIMEYLNSIVDGFSGEIYGKLWNVFIENNMALPLMDLNFFRDSGRSKVWNRVHKYSEERLTIALDNLCSYAEDDSLLQESFQYRYSELYLKGHINFCCFYQHPEWLYNEKTSLETKVYYLTSQRGMLTNNQCKKLKYYVSDLYKSFKELHNEYECNPNIHLLFSRVIAKYASDAYYERINAYKKAISCFKDLLGESNFQNISWPILLNFVIATDGTRYKLADRRAYVDKRAKDWYEKAYNEEKNYILAFECGMEAYKRGLNADYLRVRYFKNAIEYFKISKELIHPFMDEPNPKELHYSRSINSFIFKLKSKILQRLKPNNQDWLDFIKQSEDILAFYENVIKDVKIYQKIYGENAEFYLEICKDKLEPNYEELYLTLETAYNQLPSLEDLTEEDLKNFSERDLRILSEKLEKEEFFHMKNGQMAHLHYERLQNEEKFNENLLKNYIN